MSNQLDILYFAAHPDDAEISAGGSIAKAVKQGYRVGIADLTAGEMGSRGSAEIRARESAASSEILGIHARVNLGLRDGFFEQNEASLRLVIQTIRKFRPQIVICNAPSDRHPDHGKASKLVVDACFYSGLRKIETVGEDGTRQEHWRPSATYHYIQDYYLKPDFVMDITEFWEQKIASLKCYGSQFFDPNSSEPTTPISGQEFFDFLKGRALQTGRPAGFILGEGFIAARTPGVEDFFHLK
jgi:bacillithiol biosynthesis deacetylase BshB1